MTFRLRKHGIRAILLDIEGTTTPIAFVVEVLFPYARTHLREFLQANIDRTEIGSSVERLAGEWASDAGTPGRRPTEWVNDAPGDRLASATAYLEWLMDCDRKSTALKEIQGEIWDKGYRAGELRGQVFDDVRPAFERWRMQGLAIAIYSSGSVLAQKLLFGTTDQGDLTTFFAAHFDTTVGPKTSAESYRRIANTMGLQAGQVLFVSDAPGEVAAAWAAGYRVLLVTRPGHLSPATEIDVPKIQTFDEIL